VTEPKTLVVYHTSDVHDRRGFGAKLAALVEPGALLVDCGDALRGSSTVYRRDEGVMAEFAAAHYTAQAVGNREFHYLHSCMLARSRAMRVPWICSNLIDLRDRPPAFARHLMVRASGANVRILALLAPQYRTGSGWERIFGWQFLSPEAALDEILESTTSAPSDATLVLSHLGLAADREIARRYPALTAIVGGHSHDTLGRPEYVGTVPIVQSGPYALYAGRLELSLGAGRSAVDSYRLVPLLAQGVKR
jgi:2',3'-cyclic-nucleotide 2'-phosphodiesterase (5'-nucleotidase family)